MPLFLAADTPEFFSCWQTSTDIEAGHLSNNRVTLSIDESVDASSTIIISMFCSVWPKTEATHFSMYFSQLYNAIMTLTVFPAPAGTCPGSPDMSFMLFINTGQPEPLPSLFFISPPANLNNHSSFAGNRFHVLLRFHRNISSDGFDMFINDIKLKKSTGPCRITFQKPRRLPETTSSGISSRPDYGKTSFPALEHHV